ncbi:MAG: hypothetical protein ACP5NI_09155, partial [Acetobacteraceae bacterium]
MAGLRRAVGACSGGKSPAERLLLPLYGLLWSRLGRIAARFARLAARIPPGAPPRPHRTIARRLPAASPEALAPAPNPRPAHPALRLPRRPG